MLHTLAIFFEIRFDQPGKPAPRGQFGDLDRHRALLVSPADQRGFLSVTGDDPHPLVELGDMFSGAAVSRNATRFLRQAAKTRSRASRISGG